MDTLGTISDLIRFVQTDNSQIHTMFWNRVLVLLQDQPFMGFLIFFSSRYIKRYLFQNNFRNYQFEEFIKKCMWSELDCASPKHLVFYATIILKLSPSYVKTRIPNGLFSKLVDNIDQLCLLSCFVLMDALVVMLNVADNKKVTPQFSLQFTELERRLETRINQILDESEYISALDCFEIFLKQRLFAKIPPERMSSRLIYAACRHIIIHSEQYTPAHALLDKCVRYCEDNSDVIIGLVVSYVLYSCYLVSYPLHTQHPKFLEIASRILLRTSQVPRDCLANIIDIGSR
ncbi:hypothetical protein M8J75_013078 [Diaphorina citri]|nr:hypothetical protein M8J75_013078 [Diaphorina citri]